MADLNPLIEVMDRLLSDDGCPWDRAQTLQTLRPYVIEEACEVIDAINSGDAAAHCDELGDLLLQVVFHAAIRKREGAFAMEDVIRAICDKLVRRHPHVFADGEAETAEDVVTNWEAIKAAEKAKRSDVPVSALDGVPVSLPALMRAQKMSRKAAKVGFDWPDAAGSLAKVKEELGEVEAALAAGDSDRVTAEIGDLLFATVNLARKLKADAEMALTDTTTKFYKRFQYIEQHLAERGTSCSASTLAEMDALWEAAKDQWP